MWKRRQLLTDIWKKMWFAALLLYASYFFYRWINVFIAGVVGDMADVLLYGNNSSESAGPEVALLKLAIAFGFSLLIMPLIDLLTNVLVFRKGLTYEASVIDSVIHKNYESVQMWRAGEWNGRIAKDSLNYRQMAVITPARIAADATVFVIAVVTMLQTSVMLTLFALLGLGLSALIHMRSKRKSNRYLEESRSYQDEKRQRQTELVRCHAFYKNYRCEETVPEDMRRQFTDFWYKTGRKNTAYHANLNLLQKAVVTGVFIGSLVYGLHYVEAGTMTVGDFVAVYFLVLQIQTLMDSLLKNLQTMRGYGAQENRIAQLKQQDTYAPGNKLQGSASEAVTALPWRILSFEKTQYLYPGTNEGMQERDFTITNGELLRLEGKNGSGKTTLLNLLCGLFPTVNAKIRLDGQTLAEIDLTKWRDQIGFVRQFPDVFPCSLRENVRIGNLAATEAQIDAALSKVGLTDLAMRKLQGTKEQLSGGEIKRMELARLLLHLEQCSLLIMDEPMENLDSTGKGLVEEILAGDGRARILVQHH